MEDIVFTVKEAARVMKSHPTYVYELIKAGLIPVLKLGSYKIRKESLDDFLKKYEGRDLTDPYSIKNLEFTNTDHNV